jgi:hypothetical protein
MGMASHEVDASLPGNFLLHKLSSSAATAGRFEELSWLHKPAELWSLEASAGWHRPVPNVQYTGMEK